MSVDTQQDVFLRDLILLIISKDRVVEGVSNLLVSLNKKCFYIKRLELNQEIVLFTAEFGICP